jgi:hypothetical protein
MKANKAINLVALRCASGGVNVSLGSLCDLNGFESNQISVLASLRQLPTSIATLNARY